MEIERDMFDVNAALYLVSPERANKKNQYPE